MSQSERTYTILEINFKLKYKSFIKTGLQYPAFNYLISNLSIFNFQSKFMKYARLTKEQFEELHPEFINFLATQSIDKTEWDKIKADKPEIAEQELDIFSDLIWEGVLSRTEYLEHFSETHVFLFQAFETEIHSIVIKSAVTGIDLLSQTGLLWLSEHMFTEDIEMKVGTKKFSEERNLSIFQLIQQGAYLSDGQFYKQIRLVMES